MDGLPPDYQYTSQPATSQCPSPTDSERRMSAHGSDTSTPAASRSSPANYERRLSLLTPRASPAPSICPSALIPPPSPPPSPSNPPPTLNYRGLHLVDLKKLLPHGFGKKISLNGISPSGRIFVLLTKTHFAILTKSSLICTGELQRYVGLPGTTGSGRGKKTKPPSVKTVALNDKYLFMGTDNRILVFAIQGTCRGELVYSRDISVDMMIDKLVVSPDGNTLLVLAKKSVAIQFAEVYSASLEPPQLMESFVPIDTIIWDNCNRVHSSATFSADGNKIAIHTSHCRQGHSEIRFLHRKGRRWFQCRNPLTVTVLSDDQDTQLGERGVTGVAMYDFPPHPTFS